MADGDPEDELEIDDPTGDDQVEPIEDPDDQSGDDDQPQDDQPDLAAQDRQPADRQQQDRQPSRRDTRIQTLSEEVRRKDTELADVRRRLDELSRQMTQPRVQQETAEQRAARFALMSPQEAMQETLRESEQRMSALVQQTQMQSQDAMDRAAFQARAAVDPLYAKWSPKVEGKLAELRAKGNNVEREVLLKFLIGEAALERRGSKEGKQEVRQAQRRVASQRTRPINSGSDTSANRRQQGNTLERRLENVQI